MAKWSTLKAAVAAVIKTNGNQEITGAIMQNTLTSIIDAVGAGTAFMGEAMPYTSPGDPDGPVMYLATARGTYTSFGGYKIEDYGIHVLYNLSDGTWAGIKVLDITQGLGTSEGLVPSVGLLTNELSKDRTRLTAVESGKLDKSSITQTLGTSGDLVPSQGLLNYQLDVDRRRLTTIEAKNTEQDTRIEDAEEYIETVDADVELLKPALYGDLPYQGKYCDLSGTSWDGTFVEDNAYACAVIENFFAGDEFVLTTATGSSTAVSWAWLTAYNNVISKGKADPVVSKKLIAPDNAAKLIVQGYANTADGFRLWDKNAGVTGNRLRIKALASDMSTVEAAVSSLESGKLDKSSITQTLGTSGDLVPSQGLLNYQLDVDRRRLTTIEAKNTEQDKTITEQTPLVYSQYYAECTSAADAMFKYVEIPNANFNKGLRLVVKMKYANTNSGPGLQLSDAGEPAEIYYNGARASADNTWAAGEVLDMYYDGTYIQATTHMNHVVQDPGTDATAVMSQNAVTAELARTYGIAQYAENRPGNVVFDTSSDYTDGLLNGIGEISNQGIGYHVSDFIIVSPGSALLVWGRSYSTSWPCVVGYDADGKFVAILDFGVGYVDRNTNTGIPDRWLRPVLIPPGVSQVRCCAGPSQNFVFKKCDFAYAVRQMMRNRVTGNNGYYSPVATQNQSFLLGSSQTEEGDIYIPVRLGSVIVATAQYFQGAHGVMFCDSEHNEVGPVGLSKTYTFWTYTVRQADIDLGAAYIRHMCGYAYNTQLGDECLYVLDGDHRDPWYQQNLANFMFSHGLLPIKKHFAGHAVPATPGTVVYGSGGTVGEDGLTITMANTTSVVFTYGNFSKPSDMDLKKYQDARFVAFAKVTFAGLPEGTSTWTQFDTSDTTGRWAQITQDGTYVLPVMSQQGNTYIAFSTPSASSATITVSDWVVTTAGAALLGEPALMRELTQRLNTDPMRARIKSYGVPRIVDEQLDVADFATVAVDCVGTRPWVHFENRAYVSFGTSITAGTNSYTKYIAKYFGLTNTNLGISGGNPTSMTDELLAKIPTTGLELVTICFGANSWIHSDDIDTRDRTNSIGAINYAVDYIYDLNPDCIVCLGTDIGGPDSTQCKDLKAIAERRRLFYAPTEYIDGLPDYDATKNTYSTRRRSRSTVSPDGVHLTVQGNTRMAAAFISELSKVLPWRGMLDDKTQREYITTPLYATE